MNTGTLIERLAARVPEVRRLLEEHTQYYDELLPHVFMSDVSRYVTALEDSVPTAGGQADSELEAVLVLLRHAFQEGDENVKELISVSFLESVMERAVNDPKFRRRLGAVFEPELQQILKAHGYSTEISGNGRDE